MSFLGALLSSLERQVLASSSCRSHDESPRLRLATCWKPLAMESYVKIRTGQGDGYEHPESTQNVWQPMTAEREPAHGRAKAVVLVCSSSLETTTPDCRPDATAPLATISTSTSSALPPDPSLVKLPPSPPPETPEPTLLQAPTGIDGDLISLVNRLQ